MSAEDTTLERDLRAALAPERPEPEEFHSAVERKLAALRAQGEEPARLSRAAGFLPPFLFATSGFAGKNLAGKLLAALSLPATVVGLFVYLLAAGFSSSRRLDASRDDQEQPLKAVLRWWELHRLAPIPVVALFLFLGWHGDVDVLLVVLLISMGSVLFTLRRLSGQGLASRRVIAQQTGGMLSSIGMWLWLLGDRSPELSSQPLQLYLVYLGTLTAGVACFALGRKDHSAEDQRRAPPLWLFLPFGLLMVGLFGHIFLYIAPARCGAAPAELSAWAEEEAPADTVEWRRLKDVVGALRCVGESPRLERAAAALHAKPLAEQARFVAGDAALLGLLDADDLQEVLRAREFTVGQLPQRDGVMTSLLQERGVLFAIAETGTYDEAQIEHVARRLLRSWSDDNTYAQLEDLREIVCALDLLGRADLVPELAPAAAKALVDAWLPAAERRDQAGGFVKYFRRGKTYADLQATGVAVELMARFGAPPEIALDLVRLFLLRESTRNGYLTELGEFDALPAAVLLRFEHEFGDETRPGLAQRLWSWRFLAACAALWGLCGFATLRAPVRVEGAVTEA